MIAALIIGISVGVLFAFGAFIWLIWKTKSSARIIRSLNMKLFLITLPPDARDEQKNERELIGIMEQLYSALTSIGKTKFGFFSPKPYLALELAVSHAGEGIHFYVGMPRKLANGLTKQIWS